MTTLDLTFVRQQFPAFSEPALQGWAFFENAGGSYACRQVIERLERYYRETKVQPYGAYPASAQAGAAMDEAYRRLAAYLNVGEDEVHFGPSTSQNTYVLAQAFRGSWQEGDEIIVTNQDHEANSGAWRRLEATGIEVKEWRIDEESGILDVEKLDSLLSQRTRLVVFPHCSNIIGHINPISEIATKAHDAGALILVDGVAGAPHGFPDIQAIGADLYLFSLYKTFGPHQGLMVVRRAVLNQMANQSHYFNGDYPRKKIVPAGPDHGQIAASVGIADYFDAVFEHHFGTNNGSTREPAKNEESEEAERGRKLHKLFREAEAARLAPLLAWIEECPNLSLVGPADPLQRAPTVAVKVLNHPASYVVRELAEHSVMASSGDFYAVRVLEGMNIPLDPGVLRLSFLHYTSEDEVDQVIRALDAIL
ncbi:MAG: aminotransferase class V-fold PLP-dependent enzyme [Chloroflexota bacterium]